MLIAVIMGLIWFQLPHDEESIDDRRGLVGTLYKLKNAKKRNFGLNENLLIIIEGVQFI